MAVNAEIVLGVLNVHSWSRLPHLFSNAGRNLCVQGRLSMRLLSSAPGHDASPE